MAAAVAAQFGREVLLARTNLGLSVRAAARLAGVSPTTYALVEGGDPSARLTSIGRVAWALGLKLWGKAFPVRTPSLRDTGQLRVAEAIRTMVHASYRFGLEIAIGGTRSIDVVLFGPMEILAIEIVRLLADFQAQYRAAIAKRDELAERHQRPVRLVFVVEDTRRNRRVAAEHADVIGTALPAASRDVLKAIREGSALGRDGILWLRP
jgi:hypothetical protein